MQPAPAPPDWRDTLTELPRAGLEASRLAWGRQAWMRGLPPGDGHPVLTLPAYATGDVGLAPLRRFLRALGYTTPTSRLGTNLDRGELRIRRIEDAARFRAVQSKRVASRIERLAEAQGEPISVVGWSMGGLFAFDAARRVPDAVRGVVTLGSPFGDPRGTAMWNVMRRLSGSDVPVEEQDFSTWLVPEPRTADADRVPTTVVFSARDGIVGTEVARLQGLPADHDRVRYREVDSSHLGFTVNPEVFRTLAEILARH